MPVKTQLAMGSLVRAEMVAGDRKHALLQTAHHPGLLTVIQYQIRRMTYDVSALDGKGSCNFREGPVEADHQTDLGLTQGLH
jgi:hypothetical protein